MGYVPFFKSSALPDWAGGFVVGGGVVFYGIVVFWGGVVVTGGGFDISNQKVFINLHEITLSFIIQTKETIDIFIF